MLKPLNWRYGVAAIATVSLMLTSVPALAATSPPELPMTISGTVRYANGQPVTGGTVDAVVNGQTNGSIALQSSGAFGGSGLTPQLLVSGNATDAGQAVTFTVNGVTASAAPRVTWQSGTVVTHEVLTIPSSGTSGTGSSSAVSITTTALAAASVGRPYSQTLTASGGTGPYQWAVTGGQLPAGLTLSGNTLSGTPTAPGPAFLTVSATDSHGHTARAALAILVLPVGVQLAAPPVIGTTHVSLAHISASATGNGTMELAPYAATPVSTHLSFGAQYFDFSLAPSSTYQSISLQACGSGNRLDWWNGSTWAPVSNQTRTNGCVTATLNTTTSPSLSQLTGTALALTTTSTSSGGSSGGGSAPSGGGSSSPVSAPNSVSIRASVGGTVTATAVNGVQVAVVIPPKALPASATVTVSPLTSLPSGVTPLTLLQAALVTATPGPGSAALTYVNQPIQVAFTDTATTQATIVYWNAALNAWQPLANVRQAGHTWTASVTHLSLYALTAPSSLAPVVRLAGSTRMGTAIQAAEAGYPDGAPAVVLANAGAGAPSPDALSAAGLAGAVHAPVLLTPAGALPADVQTAIATLHVHTVYVIGGSAAIGPAVVSALTRAGLTVVRQFAGQDRFQTAALVDQYLYAQHLTVAQTVFVANGATMIDALSASPVIYRQGAPVILVNNGQSQLPSADLQWLQRAHIQQAVVLGGVQAVSPAILDQLGQALGTSHTLRLGGATRNATAIAIDQHFYSHPEGVVVAANGGQGGSFVDALSAAGFAGPTDLPIVLSNPNGLPASTTAYLRSLAGLHAAWVMGGPVAIQPAVVQHLAQEITAP